MPEVIRTKNSLLLLLSIHFYEKVGNVELELTAQIIFTCFLLSRSLLLLMNELQCYSLSASSSKRCDTCFFIQPALFKFETIHWVIAPKRCRAVHGAKDSSTIYHPNLAERSSRNTWTNWSIHCPENLTGQPTSIYNLIIFWVGKELST